MFEQSASDSYKSLVIIDAHVHIYDCFDLGTLLHSAYENFDRLAKEAGYEGRFTGILFLTETQRDDWFHKLLSWAEDGGPPPGESANGWRFEKTKEARSLYAVEATGKRLTLVAGRQIIAAENLEVLALGTEKKFHDGQPLKEIVKLVKAQGAIPVIPWGAGKWLGRRGRILAKLMDEMASEGLFLGDNSGRPWFWKQPVHFRLAQKENIRILPGTDPLPFSGETSRVGSFGFMIPSRIDARKPARDILRQLNDPGTQIIPYGRLEKTTPFLHNQIAMQLRKVRRRLKLQPV